MQSRRSGLQLFYWVIYTISEMDYNLGEKQIYIRTQNFLSTKHNQHATWRAFFQGMLHLRGYGGIATPFPGYEALHFCARFLYIITHRCMLLKHRQGNTWKAIVCSQAVLMGTGCSNARQLSGKDLDNASETSGAYVINFIMNTFI